MPLRVQAIQKETWKEPTSLCCIVANKFASVEKYIQFPLVCVGAFIIYLTHTYEISEAHTCEFLCLFKGNIFSCNFFLHYFCIPAKTTVMFSLYGSKYVWSSEKSSVFSSLMSSKNCLSFSLVYYFSWNSGIIWSCSK